MTLAVGRVLTDAWALWRRDRDLLVRIGAPFLFLPDYAMKLLLPAPLPGEADPSPSLLAAMQAQAQFVSDHLAAYLLDSAAVQFGIAALFSFYAGATDVRGALRRTAWLWPRLVLAALILEVLGTLTLVLILPPLIILGRAIAAGPLLAGDTRSGAVAAIVRSVRLTRGATLTVTLLAAISLLLRLGEGPFDQLDLWLRSLHAPNPLARAIIDGAGAGASALAQTGACLIAVATYRALASKGT